MRTPTKQFLVGAGVMCAVFLWASAPAIDAQNEGQSQRLAAKSERVYSENPAAFYEAAYDSAQISSDGKWIAYHSHRSRTPVSSYEAAGSTDDLYLRRVSDGPSEEIRLTDFGWEDGVADWAPDSLRLVFDSWERGGPQGVSKPWIVTIEPSNGKPVRVERLPLSDRIKDASFESWSPKGDEIALEERTGANGHILWVVSTDGKRAEKLVEYTGGTYGGLGWTPDGKTIVYGALAGERMQIFAIPRSGGSPRQLTNDPANLMHPQVSPDGRWIACTRMSQSKEIRRLKL